MVWCGIWIPSRITKVGVGLDAYYKVNNQNNAIKKYRTKQSICQEG